MKKTVGRGKYCDFAIIALLAVGAILLVLIFLGVLAALGPGVFYNFVKDFQTLIIATVGFGGAIFATLSGFRHNIESSEREANKVRELAAEQRDQEMRALAAALSAEFDVISYSLGILKVQVGQIGTGVTFKSEEIWRPSLIVFQSNTQRIGMLGPDLASRVTHLASMSEELSRGVISRQERMAHNIDFAQDTQKQIQLVVEQANDTARRLREVAGDTETLPLPDSVAPVKD